MGTTHHSTVVCPECESSFTVAADERAALVEHGCAVCGSTLSPDAVA